MASLCASGDGKLPARRAFSVPRQRFGEACLPRSEFSGNEPAFGGPPDQGRESEAGRISDRPRPVRTPGIPGKNGRALAGIYLQSGIRLRLWDAKAIGPFGQRSWLFAFGAPFSRTP